MMGDQKVNLLDLLSEFNTQKGLLHVFSCNSPFFYALMDIFRPLIVSKSDKIYANPAAPMFH